MFGFIGKKTKVRKFEGDTLVLATHNNGKIVEFQSMLGAYIAKLLSAKDVQLDEPEETGTTFLENAKLKALAGAHGSGLPCLADDSGLCVTALGGNPGIYSARWGGPEKDFQKAMRLVHERMDNAADTSAAFVAVLVLAWPDGHIEWAEGRVEGNIVWPGRGDHGHGYDPIFVPQGETRSFAQMTMMEKNAYSHRGRALKALLEKVF